MTFQDFGTAAEIFSAIAIIITLAYGIIQIRINNHLHKVQLTTQAGIGFHEFNREVGMSPQVSSLWRRGMAGMDRLNEDERAQFYMLATSALTGLELQHRLKMDKMIADPVFERSINQIKFLTAQRGIQEWWPRNRGNFNADFAATVDEYFSKALAQPKPEPNPES